MPARTGTKTPRKGRDSGRKESPPGEARIVVCDDHPIVCERLSTELDRVDRVETVTTTSDVSSLIEVVASESQDIALIDIELPDDDGLNAIDRVAEVDESVRSIMLSAHRDPELIVEARRRGAAGFVPKTDVGEAMIEVIETVLNGGESFPPVDSVTDRIGRLLSLSPREREILDLIADGLSAEDIGSRLGISKATVYTHIRNAVARLGVRSRGEAIALSVKYSYLNPRY